VGKPTDEGIAFTAIIRFPYRVAPNDGGLDDSNSTMNYQIPNPREGRAQLREQKIEVHYNA